jgi:hypothetical protein
VHDFLTNPAYAGAFVFGRTRQQKSLGPDGRARINTVELALEEWSVCIPDHHVLRRLGRRSSAGHALGHGRERDASLDGLSEGYVAGPSVKHPTERGSEGWILF